MKVSELVSVKDFDGLPVRVELHTWPNQALEEVEGVLVLGFETARFCAIPGGETSLFVLREVIAGLQTLEQEMVKVSG